MPRDTPVKARRVAALIALSLAAAPAGAQTFHASITVERVVIDAHIQEYDGTPIEGITPADLTAQIDGRPAEVESVDWIDDTRPAAETPRFEAPTEGVTLSEVVPRGRLIVMFFQTDFQREGSRVKGQMRIIPYAEKFLAGLMPDDRVAVVSFDSHLKLRQDFTEDRALVAAAVHRSLRIDNPEPPPTGEEPSLFARLGFKEAFDCASHEKALLLVANALKELPGRKSIVLFGWGLGRFGSTGVVLPPDYFRARTALAEARTSVYVLDISDADYHSLEVGLDQVAEDTGGFYVKTNNFPQMAVDRLERVLSGHYSVVVKKPEGLESGTHSIGLRLKGRKGEVLARMEFAD